MATLSKSRGYWLLQFRDVNRKRQTIGLGKVDRVKKSTIQATKLKIEQLISTAAQGGRVDPELLTWANTIDARLAKRLAELELIPPQQIMPEVGTEEPLGTPLGEFLDRVINHPARNIKESTRTAETIAAGRLKEFFACRLAESITRADALDFVGYLRTEEYSEATISKNVKLARQFFRELVEEERIAKNPFAKVKVAGETNEARKFYVKSDVARQVLDACPDSEWRLLFALCRFAGLRCPSEHVGLNWEDVLWDQDLFRVTSPKTEHHRGKGERWVPIFGALRPYLEESYQLAMEEANQEGRTVSGPIFPRLQGTTGKNANLRTMFARIVHRAGVTPWPRLFHNLRASCQTDLVGEFPLHLVCQWLGNSQLIAFKHYTQERKEDIQRAAAFMQLDMQQTGARPTEGLVQTGTGENGKRPVLQVVAPNSALQGELMGVHTGLASKVLSG